MARRVVVTRGGQGRQRQMLPLAFVLVALAGFALGWFVRGGGSAPVAAPPQRMTIKPPAAEPADPVGDRLTFYDNLPRGEQTPLGSGINPPPPGSESTEAAPDKPPATRAAVVTEKTASPAPRRAAVVAAPATDRPAATAPDRTLYLAQAASFRSRASADALTTSLHQLGITAYVQSADLGAKGTWFRVYAGPFTGKAAADQAVTTMRAKLKLKPVLRKES